MAENSLTDEQGVLAYLRKGLYPHCSSVERLPEGDCGFVFRAFTGDDEPAAVIVKHAEGYAARAESWKLNPNRMEFEHKAMHFLSSPAMQSDPIIRMPKLLQYDQHNQVLIMEDAGTLPSLKAWLKPDNSAVQDHTIVKIGTAVGSFLARLHNSTAGNADLLAQFDGNETAKYLSGTVYFANMPKAAEVLGFTDSFIAEAAKVGEQEVLQSSDVLTMGDFWTGNILVSSKDTTNLHLYVLDWELAKPGTAEFDIGQMAAEIYCAARLRKGAQHIAMKLLNSFLVSYRETRAVKVDAAKVLIRMGAHWLVIMPRAWSNEATADEIKEATREGRDMIRIGWENDPVALKASVVGPLLA